jgi:hypothetical protein
MEPSNIGPDDAGETTAETVARTADRLRQELAGTEGRVLEVVRAHPFACVLGAVMGGYLLGRVARRL